MQEYLDALWQKPISDLTQLLYEAQNEVLLGKYNLAFTEEEPCRFPETMSMATGLEIFDDRAGRGAGRASGILSYGGYLVQVLSSCVFFRSAFRSRRISARRFFLRSSSTSVPRRKPRSRSRGLFVRRKSLSLIRQLSIACSSALCMLVPRLATAMRSSRCFAAMSRNVVTTLSLRGAFMISVCHRVNRPRSKGLIPQWLARLEDVFHPLLRFLLAAEAQEGFPLEA